MLPKLSVFQQDMGHSENGYATTNYTYYLYDFKCRSNVKMRAFSLWASLDTLYPGTSLQNRRYFFFAHDWTKPY